MTHAWGIKRTLKGEKKGYLVGSGEVESLGYESLRPRSVRGFHGTAFRTRKDARVIAHGLNRYSLRYHYTPVKIQITVREIG